MKKELLDIVKSVKALIETEIDSGISEYFMPQPDSLSVGKAVVEED